MRGRTITRKAFKDARKYTLGRLWFLPQPHCLDYDQALLPKGIISPAPRMSPRPSHQSVLEATESWRDLDYIREVHKDLDLHIEENTDHHCREESEDTSLSVLRHTLTMLCSCCQDTHTTERNFPPTPQTSLASATKTLG